MTEKKVTIRNKAGIHCRPSSVILNKIRSDFPDTAFTLIPANGRPETQLNSILSLISLGLQCGDEAVLRVEGTDEEKACAAIAGLLEYEFDFPPLSS
ncbi:MAG: HPr family phosphocarrier protein [Victivallaceae bacterium]|nr:HPr family phosphocarrier protein [Victivallaceae bacterium]